MGARKRRGGWEGRGSGFASCWGSSLSLPDALLSKEPSPPCSPCPRLRPVMDLERVGLPLLVAGVAAALTRRWWLPRVHAWWRRRKLKHAPKQRTSSGLGRDLDV